MSASGPQGPYEKYKAKQPEHERRIADAAPMKWWWFKQRKPVARFTLYVGFFTLALVIVGFLQWCTLQQTNVITAEGERGWIAPTDLYLEQKPILGLPVEMRLGLFNSGKRPATNGKIITVADEIPIALFDAYTIDASKMPASGNLCDSRNPIHSLPAIWPTAPDSKGNSYMTSSAADGGEVRYDAALLSGHKFYRLRGCITYEAAPGVNRKSWFCFIMHARAGEVGLCRDGNGGT